MRAPRLIWLFIQASTQQDMAYRANFWIHLLHSLLNLATGVLGVVVLFGQIQQVKGWELPSALAILGVYLILGALRGLVFGPSFETLAGLEGEIMRGDFDFTLVRPINTQFLISFRRWNLFALFDLALGLGVLVVAAGMPGQTFSPAGLVSFLLAMVAGVAALYAVLLAFTALVFWSPGFLFTWVFDAIFQMARYPVDLYPGWLRLVLTWVVPVGLMTTIPVKALSGGLSAGALAGSLAASAVLVCAASLLFRTGLRRYASASS